ncbi:MAG TPA: DegV family protein [Nocardioidaceae bacterium]|jgi:DegV family protein with EDD domain|nr:DegV family protein [Nocardioidaceae bacterium]
MSRSVAVVTDSTASLPEHVVAARSIIVVPLQVVVGAEVYDEGSDETQRVVTEALRVRTAVSTSRPAPETFAAAYEAAAAAGATAVVSVHLSAEVSGTYDSAVLGAAQVDVPVLVVDSRQVGLATGFAALWAADVADRGGGADAAAEAARARALATSSYVYVDTLEHLRRGGRIGAGAALLGSALAVKPLLTVTDGRVEPLEKVRTAGRAMARIEELAVRAAGSGPVDVAVQHLDAERRANVLAEALGERVPRAAEVWVREVSAVIGAHVGPGMVAVIVAPYPA